MLTLLRQLPYFRNKKYVLSSFRCIYSRNPSVPNFGDSTKNGYGEKEICLLKEIDRSRPLPGDMSGLPLRDFYTIKIKRVPTPTGKKWEASIPLPEEKHKRTYTQYAFNSVNTAMSIFEKAECVAHKCPTLLRRDFLNLFPSRYMDDNITLVTLCLKTENDMSIWSEEAEKERKELSQYFVIAAQYVTTFLVGKHFWADFVHPTTGKPHSSPLVDDTMFETDLRYRNFGLQVDDLGCCRIISHPIWGTNVFVGAIFTNAPFDCGEVDCIKRKDLPPVLANINETAV